MGLVRKSTQVAEKVKKYYLEPVVDGDTLIYKCGMAGQYTLTHIVPKGKRKPLISLRYKKDIKDWHVETGLELGKDVRYVEEEVLEPLPSILDTVDTILEGIEEHFGQAPVIFVSGQGNYREWIATELPYKGNRWEEEQREAAFKEGKWLHWLGLTEKSHTLPQRPKHKQGIVSHLIHKWGAQKIDNIEADDMLGIYQMSNPDTVLCHEDKDINMIPGYHFNPFKKEASVYFVSATESWQYFYRQLLTGDDTDNIPGIKGMGAKKASNTIDHFEYPDEMYRAVQSLYKEHYGKDAERKLLERGQLLWILREHGSIWRPPL